MSKQQTISAMAKEGSKARYPELDAFRGLAILAVLLFHYTTRYDEIYGHAKMLFAFPQGKFGVQFFFMLSGFVIYRSLENVANGHDFIFNRFFRLYPAYWCSVLLTFATVYIFSLPGRETTLLDAILNLTMLQDWLGQKYLFPIKHVDGAYWTLSRFISFYIFIFLINRWQLTKKIHLVLFLWLLSMCSVKLISSLGINCPEIIKQIFLLSEGSYFIMGMMFFILKKYGCQRPTLLILLSSLITILLVEGKINCLYALSFATLFLLFLGNHLSFLKAKPLIFLGTISYSLYLLHQNIGYVIIRELYRFQINYFFIIAIATAIAILLATAVTHYIEKPARRYFRSPSPKD